MDCFSWAEPYPEIHKICKLFQLTELYKPINVVYKPLEAYIQNGPQCGLVALAMIIGKPIKETIQLLLEAAKRHNYTYNGEMFSVNYMAALAKEFNNDKQDIKSYCGNLYNQEIINYLLDGAQMIVPYDTNKDNSPGLHEGHKAHWCAISGIIQTSGDIFVIARHGKVKNVAIWNLRDLANSNAQLHEFSPDRKLQQIDYKLPEGGINGPLGLNSKSVIILNC